MDFDEIKCMKNRNEWSFTQSEVSFCLEVYIQVHKLVNPQLIYTGKNIDMYNHLRPLINTSSNPIKSDLNY